MRGEQAVALSDANEHLVYACLVGDEAEIAKAKDELEAAKNMPESNWLEQVRAEAARDALIEASEQLPDFPGAGYAHYTRAWLFSRGQDQVTPPIGGEAS